MAKQFAQRCPSCGGTYRVEEAQRGTFECAGCGIPCLDLEAVHSETRAKTQTFIAESRKQ